MLSEKSGNKGLYMMWFEKKRLGGESHRCDKRGKVQQKKKRGGRERERECRLRIRKKKGGVGCERRKRLFKSRICFFFSKKPLLRKGSFFHLLL